MENLCPYCRSAIPLSAGVNQLELRICPACHASFLSATKLPALRRLLDRSSRQAWLEALQAGGASQSVRTSDLVCLDHGEPLLPGDIPDYVIPGHLPSCCQLLHLTPGQMQQILNVGLVSEPVRSRSEKGGAARFLGAILYRIFNGKNDSIDVLEGLAYSMRIQPILEGRDPASK